MKKLFKFFSLIILALVIGGGIFLYLNFGSIAKNMAEKIATNALGVNVSISSLSVSLKDKTATVKGIKIANPSGFKNRHIMTISQVDVGLKAVSKTLIDFSNIAVSGTNVNLEVTQNGTNVTALKNKMASQPKKQTDNPIRVIIRSLTINQSTVTPTVTLLKTDIGSIVVPPVKLSGIGVRDNGVHAKEAVRQVIQAYLKQAESQISKEGLLINKDEIINRAKDKVNEKVNDTLKNITKDIKLF